MNYELNFSLFVFHCNEDCFITSFRLHNHFLQSIDRIRSVDDATIGAIETNQDAAGRNVFDGLAHTDAYILESWHPQQQGQPAVLLLAIGDDHS